MIKRLHYTEQTPCVLGLSTNFVEEILSRYPPTKLHHVTANKHHYTNQCQRRFRTASIPSSEHRALA